MNRQRQRSLVLGLIKGGTLTEDDIIGFMEDESLVTDVSDAGTHIRNGKFETDDGSLTWEIKLYEDVEDIEVTSPGGAAYQTTPDTKEIRMVVGEVSAEMDKDFVSYLEDENPDWNQDNLQDAFWDFVEEMTELVAEEFDRTVKGEYNVEVKWDEITRDDPSVSFRVVLSEQV